MSWYYAENNERRGPIDEAAFQALVSSGAIKPETLVWQEGMPNWIPYSQVNGAASTPPPSTAAAPPGSVQCSQCGGFFPASDVITIAGRNICATCKPLAVQQMVEGADTGGASIDAAKLLADVRARGGYRIDVGSVVSRAWATYKANLWPMFGTVLLAYLVLIIATSIPCVGIIAAFFVTGPILGGIFYYLLKNLRRQPSVVGDVFAGFNKPHFGQLALAGTVQTLAVALVAGIIMFPIGMMTGLTQQTDPTQIQTGMIVGYLIAAIPIMYLFISWLMSYAFIIDKRVRFWDAMELSRKLVNMNLGGWILLMLVSFLLTLAGFLALCVGIFLVIPMQFCMVMVVYEDILSARTADVV